MTFSIHKYILQYSVFQLADNEGPDQIAHIILTPLNPTFI